MIKKHCDDEKVLWWLKSIVMIERYSKWKIKMKNRNENENENDNDNDNENGNENK